MRVTFVLPAPVHVPMGGAAVVYRHAAGLAARGHQVTVVSPRRAERGPRAWARHGALALVNRLQGVAAPYYHADGVRSVTVGRISPQTIPPGDVVIATGVQTVAPVLALPAACGRPVHFVQGDETFVRPDARDAWHAPMARITCSRWLAEAICAAGSDVAGWVPNAVDPDEFGVDVPPPDRAPSVVAMYHRHPVKGPDVLTGVLARLAETHPDVPIRVFAARPPARVLPRSADVHVRPSRPALRALYNASAVHLHTSRSEGWGLVPMEAAACGCAVVATDHPGVAEFLRDGQSMVTAPVGDVRALAAAAGRLLDDIDRRVSLAEAGRARVAAFAWERSTAQLEGLLLQLA